MPHPKSLKKLQSTNAKIPPCLPGRSGTDSLLSECVTTTLCPVSAPLTGKAWCGSGVGCSMEALSPCLCLLVGWGVRGCFKKSSFTCFRRAVGSGEQLWSYLSGYSTTYDEDFPGVGQVLLLAFGSFSSFPLSTSRRTLLGMTLCVCYEQSPCSALRGEGWVGHALPRGEAQMAIE